MNTISIMILFGLIVPIFHFLANTLTGRRSAEVKDILYIFANIHPVKTIFGSILALIPAVAYWVYVIIQINQ